jgi:hypothetical protein
MAKGRGTRVRRADATEPPEPSPARRAMEPIERKGAADRDAAEPVEELPSRDEDEAEEPPQAPASEEDTKDTEPLDRGEPHEDKGLDR